ncbi:MAG: fumarylacetoacetate hydrolase family protein [Candidatus Firestonebacteria bacterium]|nr:fumarylacetoacetate hydrolase family protein [Candidatus Firestonebacteria bacterium]
MSLKIFARISWKEKEHYALKEGDRFRIINSAPYELWEPTTTLVPAEEIHLLAPVKPSKIIAVGLNYRNHAQELNMQLPSVPLLFLKPPTAVANPEENIVWPLISTRVDFEGELAMVIGRKAKNVSITSAMDYVLGFTLANDITARDLQTQDGQWTRAKGFDGFCPLGPVLVTELDWNEFELKTYVATECRQSGKISDLIFSLPEILSFASQVMTLLPGDVILTGTPSGIGPLQTGEQVSITEKQIGSLKNQLIRQA